MVHAQKPDLVFRRNGRVHLNRPGGGAASVQSTTGSRGVRISGDTPRSEIMWRVLATHCIRQFPLHFPSRVSPCPITFQVDSTLWLLCFGWSHKKFPEKPAMKLEYIEHQSSCSLPVSLASLPYPSSPRMMYVVETDLGQNDVVFYPLPCRAWSERRHQVTITTSSVQ